MTIHEVDLKLLWGRSGNRCTICRCAISLDKEHASAVFPLGENAHIVARMSDGPRGISILNLEDRDSFGNLILLCPNCHVTIDKNVEDYPVEKLHLLKSRHELWVRSTLAAASDAPRLVNERIYAGLIDRIVEDAQLREWTAWTSWALSPIPVWSADAPVRLRQLSEHTFAAVWPGKLPELERAMKTLVWILHEAISVFLEHSKKEGINRVAVQFYQIPEWDEAKYRISGNFSTHGLPIAMSSFVKRRGQPTGSLLLSGVILIRCFLP
jgi:hypothetical protein